MRGRSGTDLQLVAVDREAGVVIAILCSWPEATPSAPGLAQLALVDTVCEQLGD